MPKSKISFQNALIKLHLNLKVEKGSDHVKTDKIDIARVRLEYT